MASETLEHLGKRDASGQADRGRPPHALEHEAQRVARLAHGGPDRLRLALGVEVEPHLYRLPLYLG